MAVLLAAVVLAVLAGPSLAQTETTIPPTDAGPTTVIPTTPPPTTAPACEPVPAATDVVFLGIMVDRDGDVVRFEVRSVQQGEGLPTVVGVTFGGDARYFERGEAYRVVATPAEPSSFTGQVRQPEGLCLPLTLTAAGEPLDTSVFGRFFSRWPSILWYLAVPVIAVLVVLVVVVGLKRLVVWAFR